LIVSTVDGAIIVKVVVNRTGATIWHSTPPSLASRRIKGDFFTHFFCVFIKIILFLKNHTNSTVTAHPTPPPTPAPTPRPVRLFHCHKLIVLTCCIQDTCADATTLEQSANAETFTCAK